MRWKHYPSPYQSSSYGPSTRSHELLPPCSTVWFVVFRNSVSSFFLIRGKVLFLIDQQVTYIEGWGCDLPSESTRSKHTNRSNHFLKTCTSSDMCSLLLRDIQVWAFASRYSSLGFCFAIFNYAYMRDWVHDIWSIPSNSVELRKMSRVWISPRTSTKQALEYWSWDGARKCTSNERLNSFHARELLNQAKQIKLSKSKKGFRSS